jgi:hypothetical protein
MATMGFYVTNLGRDRLILGHEWFRTFNPQINWKRNALLGEEVVIETTGYLNKLRQVQAVTIADDKEATQQLIPEAYRSYWKVFSEEQAKRFPPEREEDHAITLKKGAPAKLDCKIYRQMEEELEATRTFIQESLEKGYIVDSKSPYAAALFY